MTKLYKASVSDHHFTKEGIGYFVQHGEPQTVGGDPMVRLAGGVIVPANGWHADFSDAVLEAAQRIESLGHRLVAQAAELRAGAQKGAQKQEVPA
jgi:hypothetical protein